MEKETARAFKGFQKLLGPAIAGRLSQDLGTLLARFRASSASSISKGSKTPLSYPFFPYLFSLYLYLYFLYLYSLLLSLFPLFSFILRLSSSPFPDYNL